MTRRVAPQPGVPKLEWEAAVKPRSSQGRALARGLEGRPPLQHHHASDQNSSSSRCRASFSPALKHGIYRASLRAFSRLTPKRSSPPFRRYVQIEDAVEKPCFRQRAIICRAVGARIEKRSFVAD